MRLKFLSPDPHKQEIARRVGAILFFVGGMLFMSGYETEDLFLFGVLMLIWYSMSWLKYRNNPKKSTHWLQQFFYFLLFLAISVICGVIRVYLPNWVAHEILGILINLFVMLIFLFLLFYRGGSSKSDIR